MTMPQRLNARYLRAPALTLLGTFLLFGGNATNALANGNVPFESLGGDKCFMFSNLLSYKTEGTNTTELPLQLVINNKEDYQKLFDPKIMRQSCADADLSKVITNVDFSKQTVLGLWSSGSCAATAFEKRVLRDDINKSIIYSVSVIESALSCSGPGLESLNLIAIPKVPVGYKVVFEKISG
jgi:hypothetical protein